MFPSYFIYCDKGSLFENFVYLKIKHYNPGYIYQNTTEIDFYIPKKALIEVKFHDEPLSVAQQKLFDEFPAPHKSIIRSDADLNKLIQNI